MKRISIQITPTLSDFISGIKYKLKVWLIELILKVWLIEQTK